VRRHVIYVALFSLLYNIPRFFEYEQAEICVGYNATREVYQMSAFGGNTVYRVVYANVLYFVVMLGGPLLSLAVLNANLIRALKRQARRRTEMGVTSGAGNQSDVTLVLVVVVFAFIVCQTPTFVDHIFWTVLDESLRAQCGVWHYHYTALGDMMAIFNSSVNFVIYVLTSPKFRQHLASICVSRLKLQSTPGFEAVVTRLRQADRGRSTVGANAAAAAAETILLCRPGQQVAPPNPDLDPEDSPNHELSRL